MAEVILTFEKGRRELLKQTESPCQFCVSPKFWNGLHCAKSVRIPSYSGPHLPAFGLNTERYSVSLLIQSECGKMRTRITPNTNTFYAVLCLIVFIDTIAKRTSYLKKQFGLRVQSTEHILKQLIKKQSFRSVL